MKTIATALICLAVLAGCTAPDNRGATEPTDQPKKEVDYQITYLFEVDGVKMYRFYDHYTGHRVYFTSPSTITRYEYTTGGNKRPITHHRVECMDGVPNEILTSE